MHHPDNFVEYETPAILTYTKVESKSNKTSKPTITTTALDRSKVKWEKEGKELSE